MLMDIIKSRHSIRKYTDEQISREDLEKILEAGNFAPNAGGGQRSMMVALHNRELTRKLGVMNLAKFNRGNLVGSYVSKEQPSVIDDPSMKDGFYGAPTVIAIFSQGNFMFKTADAFCMAENIVLQATELGIASCIISRGEETFDSEEGRALMKEWGVPDNYICQGFVILGYIDGEQPVSKPRKPGRVRIIEYSDEEDEYLTHDSYKFHIRSGYTKAAHMKTIGKKFDRWYDLLWMQKKL